MAAKIFRPTTWINIYREVETAPPRKLWPFLAWCLDGAYIALVIAACASVSLGIIETYVAALLGYIIDVVIETPPNRLFVEQLAIFVDRNWLFDPCKTNFLFCFLLLSINGG